MSRYIGYIGNRRLNNERKYLDFKIDSTKNRKTWHIKPPCEPQKYIKHLRRLYHELPAAIERANKSRERINTAPLRRLPGQVGNALRRRGVDDKLGAEHLCIDFTTTFYGTKDGLPVIKPVHAWYAPEWLVEFFGKGDRRHLYKRLDGLKDADIEEIEAEMGLMLLGVT